MCTVRYRPICIYVCVYTTVKSDESDDSSETDSAEESDDDVKPSVTRVVEKRDRKPSTASTVTTQNKVVRY